MAEGWIALHRRITEHWLWKEKPFSKGQAWIDILLECNHAERKTLIKGVLLKCSRGESINSLKTWAARWGWTVAATRHFLFLLEQDEMIQTKNERVTTRLSVCNYESYQDKQHAEQTQSKRRANAEQTQSNTNNNDNNDNKGTREQEEESAEAPPLAPVAVILLPTNRYATTGEEFVFTEANREEYASLYLGVNIDVELRKMRAWLISNEKRRKTKGGMLTFVNTWLSKAQNESNRNGNGIHKPTGQPNGRNLGPNKAEYDELGKKWGIGTPDENEGARAVPDAALCEV